MPEQYNLAAGDVFGIAVTLALTFVLGLEREEAGARDRASVVAGVRTIPIIGLLGHSLALLSSGSLLPVSMGLGVVGAFLLVNYWFKLAHERTGVTTECTALIGYMVGAMVAYGRTSAAAALTVATVLLLTGKHPLRQFAARVPAREITTFVTFLLLAGVILPILPNQDLTRFRFNPFQIWLVVVAVSGISYASYLLQKVTRSEESLLLTALLGGLYSSTATTVALARRSVGAADPRPYAGAIILASGTMYIRVLVLVWAFASDLAERLAPTLIGLAVIGCAVGVAMILLHRRSSAKRSLEVEEAQHPLEIRAAVVFAGLYLGLTVGTQLTAQYLGETGLMALAALVGLTDIVPFILGLARGIGSAISADVAVVAIMIAIASNNLVKGLYAIVLGDRRAGGLALAALTALAVLTLVARFVI